ncbi:DnaJ family molecular chaperone [Pseudoxanthobacter sp.]|uniref:DnaJ family molecular chaperone n=1 Tax=Pseudoxanthobacter sp. TaxID=1925742 RepID=UPI002FE0934A
MPVWKRIADIGQFIGQGGASLVDWLLTPFLGDGVHRRAVGFTIAIIALSAKMARADGVVTAEEENAFWRLFAVPEGEEANVRRLYRLAQQDMAGYEAYARRIADLFAEDPAILENVLDVLFLVATADGVIHEAELFYLAQVAIIFRLSDETFARMRATYAPGRGPEDPYEVLGIGPHASDDELKRQHRRLVREHHPDRMIARGVPPEFIRIATERLSAINVAWAQISQERGL